MRINDVNKETKAFIFDDIAGFETAVFLIDKPNSYYLIDTFCGSDSMRYILSYIDGLAVQKRLVIINTHYHWDHTWGNVLFKNRTIIAHNACYQMMKDHYEIENKINAAYRMGDNELTLPNLTFQNQLIFQDDGIELFHAPGHTKDSISIYDVQNNTLIVGDNLEKPLIYIEDEDIDRYINTLEKYIDYTPKQLLASHTMNLTAKDLEATIAYLKRVKLNPDFKLDDPLANAVHVQNKQFLKLN